MQKNYKDLRFALQTVGVKQVGVYVKGGKTYLSICLEKLTERQIADVRYLLSLSIYKNYNLL